MKKYALALMLLLMIATPSFALNVVDSMACKRVVLHEANDRTVLVNRITGRVKYALRYDGTWEEVHGDRQEKYQSMYNAQVHPQKR